MYGSTTQVEEPDHDVTETSFRNSLEVEGSTRGAEAEEPNGSMNEADTVRTIAVEQDIHTYLLYICLVQVVCM